MGRDAVTKPKIAAIVPMRAVSARVPGKNTRLFAGAPLYHYILRTLLASRLIDEVWIDTDSEEILAEAPRHFAVKMIHRPPELRGDAVPVNDLLLYDVQHISADIYLQTHCTNPLLTTDTVDRAIERYLMGGDHDSLFSVTRLQKRLYDASGRALNHNPAELLRTQDLPPIYEENSCLFIFTRDSLERHRHRIGAKPLMFEMEPLEAVDIDEEMDFRIAEMLYIERRRAAE